MPKAELSFAPSEPRASIAVALNLRVFAPKFGAFLRRGLVFALL